MFVCESCSRTDRCAPCEELRAPEARQVARAQRLARQTTFVTSLGTVCASLGVGLLLAELHPTSFVPFASLLLGLAALLVAPLLGTAALIARRGTSAPHVLGPAMWGLCMGFAALLFALVLAAGVSGFDP